MTAKEMDCAVMNFKDITAEMFSQYETVVFAGRLYAGSVDGLKKVKDLIARGGVKTFVVFATGALQTLRSKNMNFTNQLYEYLCDCGAALVGFADMSMDINLMYPKAVSVAIPVPADIVRSLKTAPNKAYYNAYNEMKDRLNRIATSGAEYLIDKGYNAVAMTTDVVQIDRDKWISNFPHKTVATRSGLGWIGKNCLLVTQQYGSAVRLSSILTDAPLQTADPITKSRCGSCTLCVQFCPAEALSGSLWKVGMSRSELLDEQKCYQKQVQIMTEQTGIKKDLCGKCFAVCAFTQKYIGEYHNGV